MDEETLHLLLALAAFVSLLLTARGLIAHSWPMLWLASLGFFPLIPSSLGIYAIPIVALLLTAAGAIRWHGSPRAWLTSTLLNGLLWLAILYSAYSIPLVWFGPFPLFPLSLVALLLPLVPVARPTGEGIPS